MDRVKREIRQQTAASWAGSLSKSKFAIGFVVVIVAILSWNIYKSTDQPLSTEQVTGELIGIHQVQGNTGSTVSMLAIRLANNHSTLVPAPVGIPIKPGTKVNLLVTTTEQGSVYHAFIGYKEN